MIRINLLPVRAAQKKERLRSQATILVLTVVGTIAICVLVWISLTAKVDDVQAEIRAKDAEIARLKKTIGEVDQFKKLQKDLRGKLDILATLKSNRSGPVRLLDELSKVIPEKVWVSSFTESEGAITIVGAGLTEESVAEFMRKLEESAYYMNVELDVLEQKKTDGRDMQSFKIRCTVEKQVQSTSQQ